MIDLDAALHEHGERWAAAQPPAPDLDEAVGRIARHRSHIRAQLAIAASVVGIAALAMIPMLRSENDTPATRVPSGVESRLATIALRAAEANGDPNPTRAEAVRTAVWIIQVQGHFVCDGCPRPKGATAPTGSVLTLRLTPDTYDETDFGLVDKVRDLSKLGDVIELPTTYPPPAELWDELQQGAVPGTHFTATAVYTAQREADRVLDFGTVAHDDGYVWVVQGVGEFVFAMSGTGHAPGSVPSGPPQPEKVETLMFRARDGALLDSFAFGLGQGSKANDLTELGSVITLHP